MDDKMDRNRCGDPSEDTCDDGTAQVPRATVICAAGEGREGFKGDEGRDDLHDVCDTSHVIRHHTSDVHHMSDGRQHVMPHA